MALLIPPSAPQSAFQTPTPDAAEELLAELQARRLAAAVPALVLTLSHLWETARGGGPVRQARDLSALAELPKLREMLAGLDVGLRAHGEGTGALSELAHDCADVACWLEARDAVRTALAYVEAAAALEPESAARALAVARSARAAGLLAAAGAWGAWAVRLAGGGRDPASRAAALVELGHLAAMREQYGEAARLFSVALRFALARRLAEGEGDALRGLALLHCHRSYERGEDSAHRRDHDRKALELFTHAVRAYGSGSDAVWDLPHVLLPLWLAAGEYHRAAVLGRVLLAGPCPPGETLVLASLLARAAAALGWERTYEAACHRAAVSMGKLPADTPYAECLLNLARAHGTLAFWVRVGLAADQARARARRTGDRATARNARRMLRALQREAIPRRLHARLFPDRATEGIPEGAKLPTEDPARALVRSFRRALARDPRA